MAEKKETEAKAGEASKAEVKKTEGQKGRGGTKKILLFLGGAVAVFVASIPLHLYLSGMLFPEAPFVRAAPGYAPVDSILASRTQAREKAIGENDAGLTQVTGGGEGAGAAAENGEALDGPSAPVDSSSAAGGEVGKATGADRTEGKSGEADGRRSPAAELGDPSSGAARSTEARSDTSTSVLEQESFLRLVRVYEKMRPKQVAIILTTMPERQAVLILANLRDKQAASVLAEMEPGKAARMSEMLVRWNTSEP
jgi:hypothetical protein